MSRPHRSNARFFVGSRFSRVYVFCATGVGEAVRVAVRGGTFVGADGGAGERGARREARGAKHPPGGRRRRRLDFVAVGKDGGKETFGDDVVGGVKGRPLWRRAATCAGDGVTADRRTAGGGGRGRHRRAAGGAGGGRGDQAELAAGRAATPCRAGAHRGPSPGAANAARGRPSAGRPERLAAPPCHRQARHRSPGKGPGCRGGRRVATRGTGNEPPHHGRGCTRRATTRARRDAVR